MLGVDPPASKAPKFFDVEYACEFAVSTSRDLVKGWLGTGELGAMIAAPESFKTTVSVDLACCIAHGMDWMGCKTLPGGVLVVELEGARGLRHRVIGWHAHHGLEALGAPIGMATHAMSLAGGRDSDDAKAFLQTAKEFQHWLGSIPLRLVIVDTLARASGGGDENSASDMGQIVDALASVREATGATVLVIHHSGISAKDRARGSSALHGALDAELLLTKRDGGPAGGEIRSTKMREREAPAALCFNVEVVEIGMTDDGEPVTAPVTVQASAPVRIGSAAVKLNGEAERGLAALMAVLVSCGARIPADIKAPKSAVGVEVTAWRKEFAQRRVGSSEDATRKAFQRAQRELENAGNVVLRGGWVWLPPAGGAEFDVILNN
jgi:hypothetical protein